MLITISEFKDIDMRKLMDIYSESNYENTDYFFLTKQTKMWLSKRSKQDFWIS